MHFFLLQSKFKEDTSTTWPIIVDEDGVSLFHFCFFCFVGMITLYIAFFLFILLLTLVIFRLRLGPFLLTFL